MISCSCVGVAEGTRARGAEEKSQIERGVGRGRGTNLIVPRTPRWTFFNFFEILA